jgi:hypothetical protein
VKITKNWHRSEDFADITRALFTFYVDLIKRYVRNCIGIGLYTPTRHATHNSKTEALRPTFSILNFGLREIPVHTNTTAITNNGTAPPTPITMLIFVLLRSQARSAFFQREQYGNSTEPKVGYGAVRKKDKVGLLEPYKEQSLSTCNFCTARRHQWRILPSD